MKLNLVISTFAARLLAAACAAATVILCSRYLDASGRGTISLVLFYVQLAVMFNDVVGGSTIANLVPKYGIRKLFPGSLIWSLFIAAIFLLFALWAAPETVPFYQMPLLLLIPALIGFGYSAFQGLNQIPQRNTLLLFNEGGRLLGVVVIFYFLRKWEVELTLWGFIITGFIVVFAFWWTLRKQISWKWQPLPKEAFQLGFQAQIGQLFSFLNFKITLIGIEYWMDTSSVGVFSNALLAADTLWILANSFGTVAHAKFIQNDQPLIDKSLTLYHLKWSLGGTLLGCVIMALVPNDLYISIFGKGFYALKNICIWIIPGICFFAMNTQFGHLFHARNKFQLINKIHAIGLAVQILVMLLAIPTWGLLGAAMAFNACFFTTLIISWLAFLKS